MPIERVRLDAGDQAANVAARRNPNGGTFARVLKDGQEPTAGEWLTVHHAVVCPAALAARAARKGDVDGVIPFPTAKARRSRVMSLFDLQTAPAGSTE